MLTRFVLTVFLAVSATAALADESCSDALVMSTYSMASQDHVDWRLSTLVSKDTYDQITHSAGANVPIYGIPAGANYDDYHSRSEKYLSKANASLSHTQALNIAWKGLDPASATAYRECLDSKVFLADGLHAAVQFATDNDVTILVKWHRTGDASPLAVQWLPSSTIGGVTLPTTLKDGLTAVLLRRPNADMQIVGNGGGYTTGGIVISPVPPYVPLPTFSCTKDLTVGVRNNNPASTDSYHTYYAYQNGEPWRFALKKSRWGLGGDEHLTDIDLIPPSVGDISMKAKVDSDTVFFEPRSSGGGTAGNVTLRATYSTQTPCS